MNRLFALMLPLLLLFSFEKAAAFTQKGLGGACPIGHEWITTLSATELVGADWLPSREDDPRFLPENTGWLADTSGLAHLLKTPFVQQLKARKKRDHYYHSTYEFIYATIVGERWVDMAGVNVMKAKWAKHNCFDAVAQEDPRVQYDHFMRRYDEHGAEAAVLATDRSVERFITYFVQAATAEHMTMMVWDGGGHSKKTQVDRNFFLFGRALHLFQDSFSPEHTVRSPSDHYRRIRQVKSYLCSKGAEQHAHSTLKLINYSSGDVIWKRRTQHLIGKRYLQPRLMKIAALVATEATKDLWLAFFRTMAVPQKDREVVARRAAEGIAEKWLAYDAGEMQAWYEEEGNRDGTYVLEEGQTGKGADMCDCLREKGLSECRQEERIAELEKDRCACLYNMAARPGYSDLNDPQFKLPYFWTWKSRGWLTPPSGWQPEDPPANAGKRVVLENQKGGEILFLDERGHVNGVGNGQLIEVISLGTPDQLYLRDPKSGLFLGVRRRGKSVALLPKAKHAQFRLETTERGNVLHSVKFKAPIGMDSQKDMRVYLAKGRRSGKLEMYWKMPERKSVQAHAD